MRGAAGPEVALDEAHMFRWLQNRPFDLLDAAVVTAMLTGGVLIAALLTNG